MIMWVVVAAATLYRGHKHDHLLHSERVACVKLILPFVTSWKTCENSFGYSHRGTMISDDKTIHYVR